MVNVHCYNNIYGINGSTLIPSSTGKSTKPRLSILGLLPIVLAMFVTGLAFFGISTFLTKEHGVEDSIPISDFSERATFRYLLDNMDSARPALTARSALAEARRASQGMVGFQASARETLIVEGKIPVLDHSSNKNHNLIIKKIGVDIPIVEGKTESALWRGAWRSPWSSTPDKGGNTVIFGHRYRYLPPNPETFFLLNELQVGDTFEVNWGESTYNYRVVESKIIPPKELSVLAQTTDPTITLITCTPVYTTKNRLVVRGELI